MTKLIVQIPCWNEEATIGYTISQIPRHYPKVDLVEILVIDDGSSDKTIPTALNAGANHLLKLSSHRGLSAAFQAGVQEALKLGADIIVNIDADNQYEASEIKNLIEPIILKKADLVIGDRLASKLVFLSHWKRFLYFCADLVVSILTGIHSPDPTSGFRAMTASFARGINLRDKHSYTIETLIQAYLSKKNVVFIPVDSRLVSRPSRLIKNTGIYILKSSFSLFRSLIVYRAKSPGIIVNLAPEVTHGNSECLA